MTNSKLDPNIIVEMLNQFLAEDPNAVLEFMRTRPTLTLSAKDIMSIKGPKISIMGILNEILRRHGENQIVIGAECDWDENQIITRVRFFHLIDLEKEK